MNKFKYIKGSLAYGVSRDGEVARLPYIRKHNINKTFFKTKLHILTPSVNNSKGYKRLAITQLDGTIKTLSVHRLVALTYIPNPENKSQVNHINGDKLDNRVENLEWVTNDENMAHAALNLEKKNLKRGDKCSFSKLTEKDMRSIHKAIIEGNTKLIDLAKRYNVAPTTITEFKKGRSWRHLGLFPPNKRSEEKYFNKSRYVPTTMET